MKKILNTTGILIASALFAAPVAFAQSSSSSSCSTCTPTTQTPTTQTPMSQIPSANITVGGYAASAGDFSAMFEGDDGEATAHKEGAAYGIFDILYDSCDKGDCGPTKVTANFGAVEIGSSTANATSNTAGQGAKAWNNNAVVLGGGLQVNMPQMPAGESSD